jgi:eIF-2B alpha/beta/delta-like uncharacterized protein
MQIRGAPLIAIVAVLGLAVDLNSNAKSIDELDAMDENDKDSLLEYIQRKMDYLATARPTAVNVFNALDELKNVLSSQSNRASMCQAVVSHAEFMLQRDVSDNKAIGEFGAEAILKTISQDKQARIVTICNTGCLATAGYGTALGVVRALAEQDRLESITALETRPYNQGSRLTAFEILEESMPGGTLICDSMAGSLMKVCRLSIVAFIFCLFSTANSLIYNRQKASMPVWWGPIESVPMATLPTRLALTIYLLWQPPTASRSLSRPHSPRWISR